MIVYVNGQWQEEQEASVSFNDRGFVFADAIYEVVHIYNGAYFELEAHLTRLRNSLKLVKIDFDVDSLREVFDELLKKNPIEEEGMLYLQVSRGVAPRAHGLPSGLQPTVVAYIKPLTTDRSLLTNGIKTVFYEDIRWQMCNVKTTGLLLNCMAKEHALENGAHDAIFHRGDVVTEASASNLFIVKNGELWTHPNGPLVLPGITRDVVIRLAASKGLTVHEQPFTKEQLLAADEAFVTGTNSEVTPVVEVEGRPIGTGTPGSVTRLLQDAYVSATTGA